MDKCHFLRLPAELRNQIYHFAQENSAWGKYEFAPHPRPQRATRSQAKNWNQRSWQFFALTQTCRQLRDEYRSIWLRNLRVLLTDCTLEDFLHTFYPTTANCAPELVQLAWYHDRDAREIIDLTPLLLLKANGATTTIEFVSYDVTMEYIDNPCKYCLDNSYLAHVNNEQMPKPEGCLSVIENSAWRL